MNDSPITVVVPTRDRPALLEGCLDALRSTLRAEDQIVVVDSASRTSDIERISRSFGAIYVRCDRPGASTARNAGWREATHDVVAFIDDDVRVSPGWAEAMSSAFATPDVAFVTGRTGSPPGEAPEFPVAWFMAPDAFGIDASTPGDLGHSANMAVRRSALATIGGFDELLGAGAKYRAAEDKDLIERLIRVGLRGRYEPRAEAVHLPWRTRQDILTLNSAYGVGLGAWLVKLFKEDRTRAVRAARITVWVWGVRDVMRLAKQRRWFLSVVAVVRVAGMVFGAARAMPRRVRDGHFVAEDRGRTATL